MKQPEDPLAWWERSGTRRAVAISFSVGLVAAVLTIFPNVSQFYDEHSAVRNFLGTVTAGLGVALVFFELRHSSEANEHRAEHNRLTREANTSRDEAPRLQIQVYQLQESIETKLTKIRLYVRARKAADGVHLSVSNLSEFDLWINQVVLVVTDAEKANPQGRIIGGGTRISRGKTEDGYYLNDNLVSINANRSDRMTFHIRAVAVGVADEPVAINSPEY